MKSSELIKLRLQVVTMLYEHGSQADREKLFERAKAIINYVGTGKSNKQPVLDKE